MFTLFPRGDIKCIRCVYKNVRKYCFDGRFYAEPSNIELKYFMEDHHLYNTVKHKTCFKSVVKAKYIYLILTNKNIHFKNLMFLKLDSAITIYFFIVC